MLDLGCGDGRHSIPLARAGHRVTAIDVSPAAIAAIARAARRAHDDGRRLSLEIVQADLAAVSLPADRDLVIAHGVRHLLAPRARDRLIGAMKDCTVPGGWNVAASFTDDIPPPGDLAPFCRGLFRPGELFDWYRDWDVELERSYVLEDRHPGGAQHRHAIDKVVARRSV